MGEGFVSGLHNCSFGFFFPHPTISQDTYVGGDSPAECGLAHADEAGSDRMYHTYDPDDELVPFGLAHLSIALRMYSSDDRPVTSELANLYSSPESGCTCSTQ